MIKYGTYESYKCNKCGNILDIPYREDYEQEPIEKYANSNKCKHEWKKIKCQLKK